MDLDGKKSALERGVATFNSKRNGFLTTRQGVIDLCAKYFTPALTAYGDEIERCRGLVQSEVLEYHIRVYNQYAREWSSWKATFADWCG